ncbi:MAG: protein-glutamate O-methyltransferase [Calditrichaeota bacterium]|nr:protein-glutamate O-methyltransferase [Calditrichota bacterium]MCB9369113.1 protein-glutamate O-methyltransferase [Calditrichota bacterium]
MRNHADIVPAPQGLKISDAEFRKASELVKSLAGIHLTDGKRELVSARLAKRLRALGLSTMNDYLDVVREDKTQAELVMMLDAISTNLTSFWRESDHFDYVVEKLLPSLEASGQQEIRIWSAGCSSGEEPYGLAMLILGKLRNPNRVKLKILATDLSTRVLDIAKRGQYGEERVKNIPPELRNKFVTQQKSETGVIYSVTPAIRSAITFARLNLMEPWPMKGPFDMIFCRNVMIYFDKPTQATLVERFGKLLKSGGMLFVGHSESLAGVQHSFRYVRPTIYEKP